MGTQEDFKEAKAKDRSAKTIAVGLAVECKDCTCTLHNDQLLSDRLHFVHRFVFQGGPCEGQLLLRVIDSEIS